MNIKIFFVYLLIFNQNEILTCICQEILLNIDKLTIRTQEKY